MSQPVWNSVDGTANHYFSVIKWVSTTSLATTLPSVCTFLSQPLINLIDRAHKLHSSSQSGKQVVSQPVSQSVTQSVSQSGRQAVSQSVRQAGRQPVCQLGRLASKQACRQSVSQAGPGRQAVIQSVSLSGREAVSQSVSRSAVRQTGRQLVTLLRSQYWYRWIKSVD